MGGRDCEFNMFVDIQLKRFPSSLTNTGCGKPMTTADVLKFNSSVNEIIGSTHIHTQRDIYN